MLSCPTWGSCTLPYVGNKVLLFNEKSFWPSGIVFYSIFRGFLSSIPTVSKNNIILKTDSNTIITLVIGSGSQDTASTGCRTYGHFEPIFDHSVD